MDNLRHSPESKRFKPSTEYSVTSLASLNNDCLFEIFKLLPLRELLQLRYFGRSVNDAVCEHLSTSGRSLAVFLTRLEPTLGSKSRWIKETMLRDQTHFRLESFTSLNTPKSLPIDSLMRKVTSLVEFITNRMSNITKLALLVQHPDYLQFLAQLLLPVCKLKVLFIDMAFFRDCKYFPSSDIADAISGMTQLESLYYFRSPQAKINLYTVNMKPTLLSNGREFFGVMLPRLRVLHVSKLMLPQGIIWENLQELSIAQARHSMGFNFCSFPDLQTVIDTSDNVEILQCESLFLSENIKILNIVAPFVVTTDTMDDLNRLPNLIELHCRLVHNPYDVPVKNRTIIRLFTKYALRDVPDSWDKQEEVSISMEQRDDYVERCRKYFPSLKMLKNQRPEVIVEF